MKKQNKNKILYLCFVCLILLPGIVAAQTRLDMALPEISGQPAPSEGLPAFINYLFVFGLGAIALLALAQMMIGGIEYVLAAGNVAKHEDAVDRIQQALIGMGLLLVSYLLLNTINPDLVNLKDPSLKPLLYKGQVPMSMSVEEYLGKLKESGVDPAYMTLEEKVKFAEKNKTWLESEKTQTAIDTMIKDLSEKPNGTYIALPLGHATKGVNFLTVCNPKCIVTPLCKQVPCSGSQNQTLDDTPLWDRLFSPSKKP